MRTWKSRRVDGLKTVKQIRCDKMEHIIEYKDEDGFWQTEQVEAVSWNQALQKAPREVKESESWKISMKTELINKEEAVHSGVIDDVLPE